MMNNTGPDYWAFFYCRDKVDSYKRRNRIKNMAWTKLSVQKLYDLYTSRTCAYCNKPCEINTDLSLQPKRHHATIDRVNPLIGYSDENIVLSCSRCNTKKARKDQILVLTRAWQSATPRLDKCQGVIIGKRDAMAP